MIVLDASTIVSAAIRRGSVPDQAVRHAFATDRVAVSEDMIAELVDVLYRPKLARFINPALRDDVVSLLDSYGVIFLPTQRVTDCRDAKDNLYLELASAAGQNGSSAATRTCSSCTPGGAYASYSRPTT